MATRARDRHPDGITVRALADSLGTTVRALRHYEDADLLSPQRDARKTRLYGPEARARAELIVVLRRADVPLKAIEAALSLSPSPEAHHITDLLEQRLQAARAQVSEIERLLPAIRSGDLWRYGRPASPQAHADPAA